MMHDDLMTDDFAAAGVASGGDDDGSGTGGNDEETLVTNEGLKKLKEELEHLKTVRRHEVAERLKEAISYGDLSENSEYEEAKNEQAFLEGRIIELERQIKNAKLISDKKDSHHKEVEIGTTVDVHNRGTGEEQVFTIVGSTETDPRSNKISNESPIGKALLGKRKGDVAEIATPGGAFRMEVLRVH